MLKIKNLRGECQLCGEPIEFHAEHAGTQSECPHCGHVTELFLAPPPEAPVPGRQRKVLFLVLALLILLGGLIAITFALRRAQRLTSPPAPAAIRPSASVAG